MMFDNVGSDLGRGFVSGPRNKENLIPAILSSLVAAASVGRFVATSPSPSAHPLSEVLTHAIKETT